MKRISLIVNIVLALAIAGLYVLYFVSPKPAKSNFGRDTAAVFKPGDLKIAFLKIDSLVNHYKKAEDLAKKMADKQSKLQADFNSKVQAHQTKVADFQNKYQKGLLLRSEAENTQQQLMQAEQDLQRLNNDLSQQLAEEQAVTNRQIYEDIVQFLTEYNKDYNYTFILADQYPGNLLYANKALDITTDVTEKMNAKYEEEQKDKK